MENNEENLGSQEPVSSESSTTTTSSSSTKTTNYKKIAIIAVAVIAIIALFCAIFTRSPKDTVKSYIKSYFGAKAKTLYNLIDEDGMAAFNQLSGKWDSESEEYVYDFSNFEDLLKDVQDANKELSKDEKQEKKDLKEQAIDKLQTRLEKLKDKGYKYSIKSVKTYSVKDCKKLTKVVVSLEVKDEDGEKDTDSYTFYTMKKGLKNYIVSSAF